MKINKLNQRKGFTLVELLVVIAIIASLAAISTPAVTKALKRAALTTSVNNARQIKLAFDIIAVDFDGDYVNNSNVAKWSATVADTNSAANAFTALIDAGGLDAADEELFYSKELKTAVPTHVKGDANGTLTATEIGYSYLSGLSMTSPGPSPVVFTQVAAASDGTSTFYTNVWDNKAVICRVNGSVSAEVLNPTTDTSATAASDFTEAGINGSTSDQNVFQWVTYGTDIKVVQ